MPETQENTVAITVVYSVHVFILVAMCKVQAPSTSSKYGVKWCLALAMSAKYEHGDKERMKNGPE